MTEIMFEDKPVLFTLEGLDEGKDAEALRYSNIVWNWVLDHRSRVIGHAPLIANFKNKKWRDDQEPEVSAEQIAGYLKRINSVHANYEGGFDVFFDTHGMFEERSLVVSVGNHFMFNGFKIL